MDGHDIPDFKADKPPDYRPPEGAKGPEAMRGDEPFIMQADGKAWLTRAVGGRRAPADAATAVQPHESPVGNPLYAGQQANPARQQIRRPRIATTPHTAIRASTSSRTW